MLYTMYIHCVLLPLLVTRARWRVRPHRMESQRPFDPTRLHMPPTFKFSNAICAVFSRDLRFPAGPACSSVSSVGRPAGLSVNPSFPSEDNAGRGKRRHARHNVSTQTPTFSGGQRPVYAVRGERQVWEDGIFLSEQI